MPFWLSSFSNFSLLTKSRMTSSCSSLRQCSETAPGMWPRSWRSASSSTATSLKPPPPRLSGPRAGATSESGLAYSPMSALLLCGCIGCDLPAALHHGHGLALLGQLDLVLDAALLVP